jgi:hypothetical protein
MSFASDRRKLHDESLPLHIRASHARSCALHVAQKLGLNREEVIKTVYLETGVARVRISRGFRNPRIGPDAMRALLQGLSSSRPTWSMPSEETRMALE